MSTTEHHAAFEIHHAHGAHEQPYEERVNVGEMERMVSAILGGLMALDSLSSFAKKKPLRGLLMAILGGDMLYRGTTGFSPLYQAIGVTGHDATFSSHPLGREIYVKESITVMKPPNEVYGFWRDFRNLPRVMSHLARVDVIDDKRSHWAVHGPHGRHIEWDAEIVEDEPGELISWRSAESGHVWNQGSVRFQEASAGRGTTITVEMTHYPPAGALGAAFAWITGHGPAQKVREDLRRVKQYLETGELPTVEGQSHGTCM